MYESLPTSLLQWPHLLSFLLGYLVAQPSKLREIHQVAVPVVLKALSSVAPIRRAATATWVLAKVTVSTRYVLQFQRNHPVNEKLGPR